MPDKDRLPAGPHRALVEAVHDLYRDAGMRGLHAISKAIRKRNDLPDTVSHEAISAILQGEVVPRWPKLESLVRQLAVWSVSHPNPDETTVRFHALWLRAAEDAQRERIPRSPAGAPASSIAPVTLGAAETVELPAGASPAEDAVGPHAGLTETFQQPNPGDSIGTLSGPGVGAVFIGTAKHSQPSSLQDVPAVADTVQDLRLAFVERCGMPSDAIGVLVNPDNPWEMYKTLEKTAARASNVLMVYFVGHGLIGPNHELHLATQATADASRALDLQALPLSKVREALAPVRAQCVILVLDCCFSGAAGNSVQLANDAFGVSFMEGTYTMAAAASDERAFALPGQRHTAFSGALLRLLNEGDPCGPPQLTLGHAYRHLARTLPAAGMPRPRCHASGRVTSLVLAANPAYRPPGGKARGAADDADDQAAQDASPYKGLEPFGVEDARYFSGRRRLVATLTRRFAESLDRASPLIVTGPSGSGKSSLLFAGLVPAIKTGRLPAPMSHSWPILPFSPGPRPLAELSDLLSRAAGEPPEIRHDQLVGDPSWLAEASNRLLRARDHEGGGSHGRLVLIVDQFEQLFASCHDAAERAAFVRALCDAGKPSEHAQVPPVHVVIGIRADFFGHCVAYPELVAALEHGPVVVGPMTSDELVEAIRRPADKAGYALEDGLVDLLLRDLRADTKAGGSAEPGMLPLLSHALLATWQQRAGRLLTISAYHATGGVWQAVTRTAEKAYTELGPSHRQVAERILMHLVRIGDGTEDTRRCGSLADLASAHPDTDPESIECVIHHFADERLLTVYEDTVQITHEALVRAWPRLRDWIDADRAGLLVRQELVEAAARWDREDRDPAALYRGTRLAVARDWAGARGGREVAPLAAEFLDTSVQHELAEQDVRRRAGRSRQLLAIVTILSLLIATLATYSLRKRTEASHSRALALSRLLADRADGVRGADVSIAMQLSLAAYQAAPTFEARSSLLSSSAAVTSVAPQSRATLSALTNSDDSALRENAYGRIPTNLRRPISALTFRTNGHAVAATSEDRIVQLWDIADPVRQVPTSMPLASRINTARFTDAAAFGPDGRALAIGSSDGVVEFWQEVTGSRPTSVTLSVGAATPVETIAFSDNGRLLAAGGRDGSLRLWDVSDPARPAVSVRLAAPTTQIISAAFSPDNHSLAVGRADGVQIWDITDPRRPTASSRLISPTAHRNSVVFSPDGRTLAVGADWTVRLWDVADPRRPKALGTPAAVPLGYVDHLVFSPNGRTLAMANSDRTIWLWDVDDRAQPHALATLSGSDDDILSVAYGPDDRTVAASGADGVVRVWSSDPASAARYICSVVGAPITVAEWNRYVPGSPYDPPCRRPMAEQMS
jgi:WD40 repeat protein